MAALEALSEEECYLVAILMDRSGIDQAEFLWNSKEADDGCFRARGYQWSWWKDESPLQADLCSRAVGKSLGIKVRGFAHLFVNPGQEMLITAPELIHLEPIVNLIETQILDTRLSREMLPKNRSSITHRPFMLSAINGARIIGRIPQRTGQGVKGTHPLWLEQDECQDYPGQGHKELIETLKRGVPGAMWHAHGVTRGVRDAFYEITSYANDAPPLRPAPKRDNDQWTVHRVVAMAREDWTDEERQEKINQYGSRDDPDYRRNVLGSHGDSQNPIFVMSRLMACVDDDPSSTYNTDDYYHFEIKDTELDRKQADIVDLIDFPSSHEKYKTTWVGMDVGFIQDPTEIIVLAEYPLTAEEKRDAKAVKKATPEDGRSRLKVITRITLRRISEPAQADVMMRVIEFYHPKAFAMDSTGVGLPLFQQVQRRMQDAADIMKSKRAREAAECIKPYNFSSRILVDFDETMELSDDLTLDERVKESGIQKMVLEYCVDEDTEALTPQGWKSRSGLSEGDLIATLNTGSGMAEWQPIDAVHVFDGERDMRLIESRSFSSLSTLGHRWWVRTTSRGEEIMEWRTTDTLVNACAIPRPVPFADYPEPTLSDELVELLAWVYTEGCFEKGRPRSGRWQGLSLSQSADCNYINVERIRRVLTSLYGLPGPASEGHLWREKTYRMAGTGRITHFYLRTAQSAEIRKFFLDVANKVLKPEVLSVLSAQQLDLFIDVSMAADGSEYQDRKQFAQTVEERTRIFEMACTLRGYPTSTTNSKGLWVCGILKRSWTTPLSSGTSPLRRNEVVHRAGIVWCPETKNRTWLARRNGTIYYTGNSTDVLRTYVDDGRLWIPWDRELIGEMSGQTFSYSKAKMDRYGRRRIFSNGTFHCLDAFRLSVLGHKQHSIEALVNAKEPENPPVLDVFMTNF
jgi:hypothetical protein